MFEDKLQRGKTGNVTGRDLGNMQHQPKAWNQQTEAYTYWREHDHCGWNAMLTKPQRPETNMLFNMPDIQRNGSNKV